MEYTWLVIAFLIVRNIKEYKKADKRQALLDLEHLLDGSLKEKDLS
jgi:hypothetical protein